MYQYIRKVKIKFFGIIEFEADSMPAWLFLPTLVMITILFIVIIYVAKVLWIRILILSYNY